MPLKEDITQIGVSVGVGLLFLIIFLIFEVSIWQVGSVIIAMIISLFWSLFKKLDGIEQNQKGYEPKNSGNSNKAPKKDSGDISAKKFNKINIGNYPVYFTLQLLLLIFSFLLFIHPWEKIIRHAILFMSILLILMAINFKDTFLRYLHIFCVFIIVIQIIELVLQNG